MNNVRSILCADGRQINRQTLQFAQNPQSWRIKIGTQKCVKAGLHSYETLKVKLRGYFYISFSFVPTKKTVSTFKKYPFLGKAWMLIHSQCPLNILFCFLYGQLQGGQGGHPIDGER